jgi:hypothetical protein
MHDPHPHGAQSFDGAGVILDIGAEYRIQCNSAAMRCVASNEIPAMTDKIGEYVSLYI